MVQARSQQFATRLLLWLMAGLGGTLVFATADAAPLRMSLTATATADLVQAVAGEPQNTLFEAADARQQRPNGDPDEAAPPVFVTAGAAAGDPLPPELAPRVVPLLAPGAAVDEWLSTSRSLTDDSSADDVSPAARSRAESFVPPPPAAVITDPDPVDSVQLASGPTAVRAQAGSAVAARSEDLRLQRGAITWLVVPLVLAAAVTVLLIGGHRSGRRRRTMVRAG